MMLLHIENGSDMCGQLEGISWKVKQSLEDNGTHEIHGSPGTWDICGKSGTNIFILWNMRNVVNCGDVNSTSDGSPDRPDDI